MHTHPSMSGVVVPKQSSPHSCWSASLWSRASFPVDSRVCDSWKALKHIKKWIHKTWDSKGLAKEGDVAPGGRVLTSKC